MVIKITGKNIEISDYLKDMIEKKAGKLERYFKPGTEVNVTLSVEKTRHIAEVTIPFDGGVLRGEEVTGDMYASIDSVLDKLEKQIHKHRTKLEKRLRDEAFWHDAPVYSESFSDENDDEPVVVRTKKFAIKPRSVEEAVMQIQMLAHDFFVFSNAETGDVNVLYKRKDGNFGLIEPEYD